MKSDPNIDLNNDWKMITVFFGANDICSAQCYNKEKASARSHARKLMKALDYLYENLPRTFVNLIPVLGKCNCLVILKKKFKWFGKMFQ